LRKLFKKNIRLGILGGTFDPPHRGHLYISKIALKKLKLNKLIWIVTKKNPFKKKPYLKIKTRIKLAKNITSKEKKIFVQYFDNKIKSNNTFDLLNYLKIKQKKTKLFFLIGADNLIKFHRWNNWKKIPELAKIVVFARPGFSTKALNSIASEKLGRKEWIFVKSTKLNISSSKLRKFDKII